MKKFLLAFFCLLSLMGLTSCRFYVPDSVSVDGVVYRNGFYGALWPCNLTYEDDVFQAGATEFRRVTCGNFNWIHSTAGTTANGVLYCAEDQWEEARAYYSNADNFVYYCKIGAKGSGSEPVITAVSALDPEKFDALLTFAEKNSYDPFGSNQKAETRRLPVPDERESPQISFYRESKDGFFTSFKGDKFHVINGELWLVFYYDYGHGEYEELVAVAVPDELGQYFITFLAGLSG